MTADPCPHIDDLTAPGSLDPAHEHHLRSCPSCGGVRALCALREIEHAPGPDADDCAAWEPEVAALLSGMITDDEVPRLLEHLSTCAGCSQVMGSLSLFRHELDGLPRPALSSTGRALSASAPVAEEPAPSRAEPTKMGWRRSAMGRRGAVQLAAVAFGALVLGLWLGLWAGGLDRSAEAPVALPDPDTTTGPGGPALPVAAAGEQAARPRAGDTSRPRPAPAGDRPSGGSSANAEAGEPEPAAGGPVGRLNVACRPYCDEVLVDGRLLGASPVVRYTLAAGSHKLVLKRKERTKRVVVRIRAGEITSVVMDMGPDAVRADERRAYLSVNCTPACRSVLVDGKNAGPSPVVRYPVAPGRHRLELRSARTVRPVTVLVEPGETKNLHISMKPPGG